MQQLSGCTAKHLLGNVLDIDKLQLGKFDYVVMMGVLYHLPDPLRGLWLMRQHLRPDSMFILETLISDHQGPPLMEYLPGRTSNNDITNFWAPNAQCCRDMLSDCGLVVGQEVIGGTRAIFHATINPVSRSEMKAARAYSATS
jgi:tRNA (mo5U34)-methyltransferase